VPATYIIRIAESWVVTTDRFSFLVLRKQERVALTGYIYETRRKNRLS
jgi:hypothetical protein